MMFGGMMFFSVILIVLAVLLVKNLFRPRQVNLKNIDLTPRQILEQRYARGEIDQEQYLLMVSDLK
ncbi:MAG: SHOCT domain-containing protein [Anaerolineae bacterium]|nr:SHOCT domain-containing protein [Anaerolineae bacterium]